MTSLTRLTSTDLKKVSHLLTKKESLLQKVHKIDTALAKFDGSPVDEKAPIKRHAAKTRAKRGQLKKRILEAVKTAGEKGLTVAELAKKLHVKPNNIYSWLYTTGKKVSGLKKSKSGHYTL